MGSAGYLELEHTADWALVVWAPDFETLLAQAVLGMNSLSGFEPQGEPSEAHIEVEGIDREDLLVSFLGEVLWWAEGERRVAESIEVQMRGDRRLSATLTGRPIVSQSKEIKAVTYHGVALEHGARGLEVTLVFDV